MSGICRTCLQIVDGEMFFYIDTFDNSQITNAIPKDVLQLCVPEMVSSILSFADLLYFVPFQGFVHFRTARNMQRLLEHVRKLLQL